MTEREECDGTRNRGAFNCRERARWEVGTWRACDRHLAQVTRYLLRGEHGELTVRNVWTDER